MVVSLFSVFDPVSYLGVHINWLVMFMVLFMFVMGYYVVVSLVGEMEFKVWSVLSGMFKEVSSPYNEGLVMAGLVIFMYISYLNVVGLYPFIFSSSGHVVVTLSAGLILWLMSMVMGWMNSFTKSSAHLVPEGSPMVLAPFMVLIESVSQLIRPLTLSVRLAANIMAGHLIIGLIASMSLMSFSMFWVSVLFQSMMLVLEWAVMFIQAFVFSILVLLYSLDYY